MLWVVCDQNKLGLLHIYIQLCCVSNAFGKSKDFLINCDELMRTITEIL